MDEELEVKGNVNIQTETLTSVEEETKQTLDSLPRIEELRRSEQDVKVNTEIQGTTQVQHQTLAKDRVFRKKSEEKKVLFKKRLKIVTVVYTTILALLLGFAITNLVTLSVLDKSISTNTQTIDSIQKEIDDYKLENPEISESIELPIDVNPPRDYNEDGKELTFLDKLTILFRNIFS